MQIEQLIYTKVNPDDSPRNMVDFHTVFYPVNILSGDDLLTIEQRINIPNLTTIDTKNTLFFHKTDKEDYLVLLCLKNLPDERDTFGRCGIFLIHGFFFPRSVWSNVSAPAELLDLIKGYLYQDIKEVLASSHVNRKTGDIRPLEFPVHHLRTIPESKRVLSYEQKQIVQLLINMARGSEAELLIKGNANQVFTCMSNLFSAVPDDLQMVLGWDDVYESGNLSFFPLKIIGFQQQRPVAGNPVVIDAKTCQVEEILNSDCLQPKNSFQYWLAARPDTALNRSSLNAAYTLSLVLEGSKGTTDYDFPKPEKILFAEANKEVIEDVFTARCARIIGDEISTLLASSYSTEIKLDMLSQGLPEEILSQKIADMVLSFGIIPKSPLPASLVTSGTIELQLLNKVWKGFHLKASDFIRLPPTQSKRIANYLLDGKWANKPWFVDLLRVIDGLFERFVSESPRSAAKLEEILITYLASQKTYTMTARLIAAEAMVQNNGAALLKKEICGEDILEEALKSARLDSRKIKLVATWVKKKRISVKDRLFMGAFFSPKQTIPDEVMALQEVRNILLGWLVKYQRLEGEDLVLLGFTDREILTACAERQEDGLLNMLKNVFGYHFSKY